MKDSLVEKLLDRLEELSELRGLVRTLDQRLHLLEAKLDRHLEYHLPPRHSDEMRRSRPGKTSRAEAAATAPAPSAPDPEAKEESSAAKPE